MRNDLIFSKIARVLLLLSTITSIIIADSDISSASRPMTEDAEVDDDQNSSFSGLRWVDLSVSSGGKLLVHPSHGFVPDGCLCGVIGPSGAGKSTFLAALGGHTPDLPHLHLTGNVWYHSSSSTSYYLSPSEGEVALLQQNDAFFSMLTPRETIDLAALLQLHPERYTDSQREAIVNRILESLGLKADQHRIIGERMIGAATTTRILPSFSPKVSSAPSSTATAATSSGGGLSGGERRRLSVGLELVTAPKVLLADEATTGLDSTQAEKVITLIQQLSKERNIPAICTIHQPRASIWRKLDMIILLAPGGKFCYIGIPNEVLPYFASLGYRCPAETNVSALNGRRRIIILVAFCATQLSLLLFIPLFAFGF
jgi:ABC-type multidrug transport system ATPase subunit